MFIDKGTFNKLKQITKEYNTQVFCNKCKKLNKCIDNNIVSLVTYPKTGEKGYAKIDTYYFINYCMVKKEEI